MLRNIEIKARANDFARQNRLAEELGDGEPQELVQEDTFFHVPAGRLKLREFSDGTAELIQYERPDVTAPTESRYVRARTPDPRAMKEALANALGIRAVVRKHRIVHLAGQTRIHMDRVEGLGEFLELEVVLRPEQSAAEGERIVTELMHRLEIAEADLVTRAYVDLL